MRNSRPVTGKTAKSADDIPIAQRDRFVPDASRTTMTGLRRQKQTLVWVVWALGGLTTLATALALGSFLLKPSGSEQAVAPTVAATDNADVLLGHFRYDEAPAEELVAIDGSSRLRAVGDELRLRRPAAEKFREMVAAARAAGVKIVTISAFRSIASQKHLFFDVKAARAQVATKRAEVSAPPHYSEHHTGYAVDLGDATTPAANLNQSFENTAAYQWLKANAPRYSFELSFPRNNPQGVSYEPWHWRFVGDSDSLETFYKARKTKS